MPAAARLLQVPLDGAPAPQAVLRALAGEPWPFALTGSWAGGGAILGARPLRLADPGEDPFALLDDLPAVAPATSGLREDRGATPGQDASSAVGGGWFGWLGYGLGARVERVPPPPPRPAPLPPFQLAYYDHVLRLDGDGQWWFEALETPARADALARRLTELRARIASARLIATPRPPEIADPFRAAGAGALGHVAAVRECRERIAAGEIFQANVCLRLETAWEGDVAELFAAASARLQPAFGAAFPAPWGGVASLSPELFLRRRGRDVATGPIKGTVARAGDDGEGAAALAASAKDRAEHVMIVDLMRNDLGRVCAYGSIDAALTPELEAHPGVWHLVSRVSGRLRPEAGDGDLLRATFPPGSVTGAPKVQALQVIAELEATGRELYTGAIGFASPLAGLELSVAIRTFEARDGRLWLGAGGGIVADSDPAQELEECLVKARPLVAAVGGRIGEVSAPPSPLKASASRSVTSATARRPTVPPALSRERRRPDPAQGVFETLLVDGGEAVRAAAHLDRLAASVAVLYDAALPEDLHEQVTDAAERAGGPAALRIVARPLGGGIATELQTAERRQRPLPIELAPFALPGGIGAHKWRDRRLLDALAHEHGRTPLLLDGDGTVLEAAWGNVLAVEGDALVTPPADGRILPGVTRGALLAAAPRAGLRVLEEPLTLDRLATADAILLTSALAGVVPATLGERESAVAGALPLVNRLAGLLRSAIVSAGA